MEPERETGEHRDRRRAGQPRGGGLERREALV